MFSSNYVKISKVDWETRELEHNELLEEIARLKAENAELQKNQSPLLMGVVKKQSGEIEKLLKYKEQDDALFSYEQSNDQHLKTIRLQAEKIEQLENENATILTAYQKESTMTSLLSKKIVNGKYDCETYRTVSEFNTTA